MELKYTPRDINELEVQNRNVHYSALLQDTRMNMLAQWVQKGLGLKTKDEAFDKIEEYLKENELEDLVVEISEALQRGGLLDRDINIQEEYEKSKQEVREQAQREAEEGTLKKAEVPS